MTTAEKNDRDMGEDDMNVLQLMVSKSEKGSAVKCSAFGNLLTVLYLLLTRLDG